VGQEKLAVILSEAKDFKMRDCIVKEILRFAQDDVAIKLKAES